MKNVYKWIIGILVVLVVVAALITVPFAMSRRMFALNGTYQLPQGQTWNRGPMMDGNQQWQHPQVPGYQGNFNMHPGDRQFYNPGFGFNARYSPFGFGFMLIGGLFRLIPLALFALLLYGVFQLGKRSGLRSVSAPAQPEQPSQPAAPATESSEKPAE